MQPQERQPIFNAPAVVVGVAVVLVMVHAARALLSPAADNALVELLSFNAARYLGPPVRDVLPGWTMPVAFVSHALLHGDLMHLVVNTAWLLAVGTPVARRTSAPLFLAFFAVCAAGGALLFLCFNPTLNSALIGASGAISGLMAAVFRLMYAADDAYGRHLLSERAWEAPRLTVRSMLTRRAPLTAIIGWVGVNIVVALALGSLGEGMPIAWEAHLGGFFVGLLTYELFDRGWDGEQPSGYLRVHGER